MYIDRRLSSVDKYYTKQFEKLNNHESREAPAVFKYKGKYFLISSGCTGWECNEAVIAVADSIMGSWKAIGNPCKGKDGDKTFFTQSTFVLPVEGIKNAYVFMADRWNRMNLKDSRYVWLPIKIYANQMKIEWIDSWNLSFFT